MESASRTQQSDNIINSTPQVDNSNRIPQVENISPQIELLFKLYGRLFDFD
jgi:hypothetical protein